MISDDTPTAYDSDFRVVESVEVIDRYTVKVTYKEVLSPALASWGIWMMPHHALTDKPSRSPLQRKPIGTGPYKLESWKAGQSITLTAFHDYFEGRPKIEKVFIRVIPNQTTQYLELLNGIDIWYAEVADKPDYPYQFVMWQYSQTGKIDGINGDVDLKISLDSWEEKRSTGKEDAEYRWRRRGGGVSGK